MKQSFKELSMEKAEFVRKAPGYYVAGIAYALEGVPFPFTREKLNERVEIRLAAMFCSMLRSEY
jgi:hypothetical protein